MLKLIRLAKSEFSAIRAGKRTALAQILISHPVDLAEIFLPIDCQKSSGRTSMLDGVDLEAVDIYADAQEIFVLAVVLWKLSIQTRGVAEYKIRLSSPNRGDIQSLNIVVDGRSRAAPSEGRRANCVLNPIQHPARPLDGFIRAEADLPNFGIRERSSNGVDASQTKEILFRQTARGLNAFSRCLMKFSTIDLEEMEEIRFEHGHRISTSSVGCISYEANFFKRGSFIGDSIFLCN